jgi:hypothetical protein
MIWRPFFLHLSDAIRKLVICRNTFSNAKSKPVISF